MKLPDLIAHLLEAADRSRLDDRSAIFEAVRRLRHTKATYVEHSHEWVPDVCLDTKTGEKSEAPYMLCKKCSQRSDGASISCRDNFPLTTGD